ncbi:phage virion morphogenesis protein [Xanthomonas perforans]
MWSHPAGTVRRQLPYTTSQQRSTLQPRALSVITGTDDGGRSIARVHQEGLAEKIRPDGPKVSYEKRTLLGLAEGDYALIRDMLINRLVT